MSSAGAVWRVWGVHFAGFCAVCWGCCFVWDVHFAGTRPAVVQLKKASRLPQALAAFHAVAWPPCTLFVQRRGKSVGVQKWRLLEGLPIILAMRGGLPACRRKREEDEDEEMEVDEAAAEVAERREARRRERERSPSEEGALDSGEHKIILGNARVLVSGVRYCASCASTSARAAKLPPTKRTLLMQSRAGRAGLCCPQQPA